MAVREVSSLHAERNVFLQDGNESSGPILSVVRVCSELSSTPSPSSLYPPDITGEMRKIHALCWLCATVKVRRQTER